MITNNSTKQQYSIVIDKPTATEYNSHISNKDYHSRSYTIWKKFNP